jgi:hypothetical protein
MWGGRRYTVKPFDKFFAADSTDSSGRAVSASNVSYNSRTADTVVNDTGMLVTAFQCQELTYSEAGFPETIVLPLHLE